MFNGEMFLMGLLSALAIPALILAACIAVGVLGVTRGRTDAAAFGFVGAAAVGLGALAGSSMAVVMAVCLLVAGIVELTRREQGVSGTATAAFPTPFASGSNDDRILWGLAVGLAVGVMLFIIMMALTGWFVGRIIGLIVAGLG